MKIKIMLMVMTFVAMAAFVAFSPVRPITETAAQMPNRKDDAKEKRLQKAEKVELKSEKGTGSEDKNITTNRGKNSMNSKSTKGMTRGAGQKTCYIDINNRTDYVIDIYVDGKFRGTMAEFDSSYTTTGSGTTNIYAKAEFDDGSYLYWGPRDYACGSNAKDGYVNFVMTK